MPWQQHSERSLTSPEAPEKELEEEKWLCNFLRAGILLSPLTMLRQRPQHTPASTSRTWGQKEKLQPGKRARKAQERAWRRTGLWVSAPQEHPIRGQCPSQSCWHPPEMHQDLSPQQQSSAGTRGPASEAVGFGLQLLRPPFVCKTGSELHLWGFQRAAWKRIHPAQGGPGWDGRAGTRLDPAGLRSRGASSPGLCVCQQRELALCRSTTRQNDGERLSPARGWLLSHVSQAAASSDVCTGRGASAGYKWSARKISSTVMGVKSRNGFWCRELGQEA